LNSSNLQQQTSQLLNPTVACTSRNQLANIDPTTQQAAILTEYGREGLFTWRQGSYTSQIAADLQQGIYIQSTINQSTGAWVRSYDGAVSAKWFGAIGNGTTDDTTALQGAINYIESLPTSNYWSSYYGEVYLPTGDYLVSGLVISRPIVFGGDGPQACSISLKSGSNRNVITIAAPPSTLTSHDSYRYSGHLRGFSINGNGTSQTQTSNGIYVSNSLMDITQRYDGSIVMEDIVVRSARDTGIYIGVNRNYGSMRNTSVVYCNVGMQNSGYDWRISDCDFGNAASTCYWQFQGGATHISGTYFYMSSTGSGMVVSSLTYAPCMISGCYFDSNSMHGAYIESNGAENIRHNLTNNIFRDNSSSANGSYSHIFINNLRGGSFTGNTFIKTQSSRPAYIIYIQGQSTITWSASFSLDPSGKPFTTAITNSPTSLTAG
jgi:hypothetical protein